MARVKEMNPAEVNARNAKRINKAVAANEKAAVASMETTVDIGQLWNDRRSP
jgi:hypothetical protein